MFKFVVFATVLAVASAGLLHTPSHVEIREPAHVEIREHSLAKVGQVVESVPTAVSGYSSSVVHHDAKVVTPILAQGVKTRLEPAFRTYEAPVLTKTIVESPILKNIETRPILRNYESEPIFKSYETAPVHQFNTGFKSYETPLLKSYESPLLKSYESFPVLKSFESPKFTNLNVRSLNVPLTYATRGW